MPTPCDVTMDVNIPTSQDETINLILPLSGTSINLFTIMKSSETKYTVSNNSST
jgi:ACT domain-containing protein